MKRSFVLFILFILFMQPLIGQNKLALNNQELYEFAPLYKKQQLFRTIDSFLNVVGDIEKGSKYWEKTDIDKWGYPFDFNIMLNNRKAIFLGASDYKQRAKYLVKLAFVPEKDTLTKGKIYSIYTFIANYNSVTSKFTFEHYSNKYIEGWYQKKIGAITFYKKNKSEFNTTEAKECTRFNSEIAKIFNTPPKKIEYYSCESPVQYFQLKGYDFAPEMFLSSTGGTISYAGLQPPFRNILYSGINREIYKHEIVHFYIDDLRNNNTCRIAMEGVATFFGGGSEKPLSYHLMALRKYIKSNSSFSLNDMFFSDRKVNDTVSTLYAVGGLLAKLIYQKLGMNGIEKFLNSTCEKLISDTANLLSINEEDLYDYLLSELERFK